MAPFATSCSGICTWSLKPLTEPDSRPLAADLAGLSRDWPTQGLPNGSLSTWNSDYTQLPALDRPTEIAIKPQFNFSSSAMQHQCLQHSCSRPSLSQVTKLPFSHYPLHFHLLQVKRYRVDLEISKIFTMSSASGQSWTG